tara:strand:+ start:302 stop:721 length:420 start_codon:yes stop_codon:yes gene_type:complete
MKIVLNKCFGGFRLSDKCEEMLEKKTGKMYFELERHNEHLVSIVEMYGKNASDNLVSQLEIVEIPDGCKYNIDEYDGMESVNTYIEITEDDLFIGLNLERLELARQVDFIKLIKGEEYQNYLEEKADADISVMKDEGLL